MSEQSTRRCIGLDVHRDFAQVAIWQASAPAVTQYDNNGEKQLHVFMRGPDNHLYQMFYGSNGWQGWFDFGRTLEGAPGVGSFDHPEVTPRNVAISTAAANTDGDEPMIAVKGSSVLVSWNMATASQEARLAFSNDRGDTWTIGSAQAPQGQQTSGSDSSVAADLTGSVPSTCR